MSQIDLIYCLFDSLASLRTGSANSLFYSLYKNIVAHGLTIVMYAVHSIINCAGEAFSHQRVPFGEEWVMLWSYQPKRHEIMNAQFGCVLKEWRADGGEGVAVFWAGAKLGNGGAVEFGAVPFVLGKAIMGELAV
jgi:hypothetical protein